MGKPERVIFGSAERPLDLKRIAEKTGIPYSTLCRYKKQKDLPLSRAIEIAKSAHITIEEWGRLLR